MEALGTILSVGLGLLAAGVGAWAIRDSATSQKKMNEFIRSISTPATTKRLIGETYNTAIILNVDQDAICLVWSFRDGFNSKWYDFSDVLSCELVEDGVTIQAARDLRGLPKPDSNETRSFFNMAELRGSKRLKKVREIELRVVVNDIRRPSHSVTIFVGAMERGSGDHLLALHQGRGWLDVMRVIAYRNLETEGVRACSGHADAKQRLDTHNKTAPPNSSPPERRSTAGGSASENANDLSREVGEQ